MVPLGVLGFFIHFILRYVNIPNMIADHTIAMLWSRIHGNERKVQRLSPSWSTFKLLIVFGENLLIEKKQEQKTIISILTYSCIWQWPQSFCHLLLKGWKVIFLREGAAFSIVLFKLSQLFFSSSHVFRREEIKS